MNSLALIVFLIVTLVAMATGEGVQQTEEQDPCKNYVSLTEERRSVKHKADPNEPNLRDDTINESMTISLSIGCPAERLIRFIAGQLSVVSSENNYELPDLTSIRVII